MRPEGHDPRRHLVRRDGSLVAEDDGYPRPVKLSELTPTSARIIRDLLRAQSSTEPADPRTPATTTSRSPGVA